MLSLAPAAPASALALGLTKPASEVWDGPNPDTASAGVLVSRDGSELGHARQDHFDKPPSDERP